MNLVVKSSIDDPKTPAYLRQLKLAGVRKPNGADLSGVLNVTRTVILPEWDRAVVIADFEEEGEGYYYHALDPI